MIFPLRHAWILTPMMLTCLVGCQRPPMTSSVGAVSIMENEDTCVLWVKHSTTESKPDGMPRAGYSSIHRIDLRSGKVQWSVKRENEYIDLSVYCETEDKYAVMNHKKISMYSLSTGKHLYDIISGKETILNMAISRSGRYLAYCEDMHGITVVDSQTGDVLTRLPMNHPVRIDFGDADSQLIVVDTDGSKGRLTLWDWKTGKKIQKFDTDSVPLSIAYNASEKKIVAASSHGIGFYSFSAPQQNKIISDGKWSLAGPVVQIAPKGQLAIISEYAEPPVSWDIRAMKQVRKFTPDIPPHKEPWRTGPGTITADGNRIFALRCPKHSTREKPQYVLMEWDVDKEKPTRSLQLELPE